MRCINYIMKSCDFSRSFITFVTKNRANNARIQVEARCSIFDNETKKTEDYFLVASCKGEDTYGKGNLFFIPSYDFCMIYSMDEFMIIRTHYNAERDNRTVGYNRGHFLDVHFNIQMIPANILKCNEEIVSATFANHVLNGYTEIHDADGKYCAMIEFPIKTMNVNDIENMYQVDTGPILLPDFAMRNSHTIECFKLTYAAFNRADEVYFVIQEPTPITEGSSEKVSFYSKVIRMDSKNLILDLDSE